MKQRELIKKLEAAGFHSSDMVVTMTSIKEVMMKKKFRDIGK